MENIIIYLVSGLVIGWILKQSAKKQARKEYERMKAEIMRELRK